jgi:hypothetical protein
VVESGASLPAWKNPQRAKSMPIRWGRVLLLVVGVLALGYLVNQRGTDATTPASTSKVTDLNAGLLNGVPADIVKVTAPALYREYDENEVATDNRLKGKIIEISGKIAAVNKDFLDKPYVNLETSNQFSSARIAPVAADADKLAALRKGQPITFRCARMTRILGAPSGSDCVMQ